MGKHKPYRLTKEQIEFLSANPNVKHADEKRVSFTYEFRVKIWEAWVKNPTTYTVNEFLDRNGLPHKIIGKDRVGHLILVFKKRGRPSRAKNKKFGEYENTVHPRSSDSEKRLIESGRFKVTARGFSFSDELKNKIIDGYPEKSVEETLIEEGIDPRDVGYQSIHLFKKRLDDPSKTEKVIYSDEFIEKYKDNPYVKRSTRKQFVLTDDGKNILGLVKPLKLCDALKVINIDANDIPSAAYSKMKCKFRRMDQTSLKRFLESCSDCALIKRIADALQKIINDAAEDAKVVFPSLKPAEKKSLCRFVNGFVTGTIVKTDHMLRCFGIPRSSYYGILNNENYAMKEQHDLEDVKLIRKVIEYKGFKKGSRTIYMMMKEITGKQFSINKIRRLMQKFGIVTDIRKSRQSHINQLKLIESMVQPNYIKRRFRLARPGRYLGTDVTYLRCGDGKMRYLSAIKDLSSGRLLSYKVSESNDIALAVNTLIDLKDESFSGQVFYHTDQGATYLSPTFQNKVKEMGFTASMSRRGNCWDNAPVESCWGHFKDECDYRSCTSLEELDDLVGRYVDYYNNERPQWSRKRMTPVQFEEYLNKLDDENYVNYIGEEYEKYQMMITEAGIKARKRAHDIGA